MSAERPEVKFEIGHVLFIDIVGYSKLLITDQSAHLQTLKQIVRGTEQFRLANAEGKLLGLPTGDGGALVFRTSPEAPVLCAIEISRELKRHPELRVRMGIHSGPVNEITDLNEQANIAGAGINIAQRVMDCGDAGHILLSQHVADDLEQYPRWRAHLHDLGECEVKHGVRVRTVNFYTEEVGNPEVPEKFKTKAGRAAKVLPKLAIPKSALIATAVLILIALVLGAFLLQQCEKPKTSATTAAIPEKSVAVLPFENLSSDKENAYFADGIQDEILTRLSKIADLKVISRTSTQQYQSKPGNLSEIARQLGVAHIVEGSVQKSGEAVRVNVQLIKAANDSHLWADTFDRKLTDIFSVESEVAKAIADQLRAKLTGQEEQVIAAKPTDNTEAYDAYLRGLAYSHRPYSGAADNLDAIKSFRKAVQLDPNFALAWAWLARESALGYFNQIGDDVPALREAAKCAADKARDLQPNLGEAYLAQGYSHYYGELDYDGAIALFEKASELLPNNSQITQALALVCRRKGEWQRSLDYFRQAIQFDPQDAALLAGQAGTYQMLRQFGAALKVYDQVLDIIPGNSETIAAKAGVYQGQGNLQTAGALLAQLHPAADHPELWEAQVYQAILERRPAPIIPRLKEILARPNPAGGYINGELRFWLGWAQAVAGDRAAAQESWRQARSELEPFVKEQPENTSLFADLALTDTGLGDKAAALALSERAMAVLPIEKDAVSGPFAIETFARVAAQMGEPDRAIAALQKLLSIPYAGALAAGMPLTPALLRLDPMFDPLRNDPRFQKLAASPAPK